MSNRTFYKIIDLCGLFLTVAVLFLLFFSWFDNSREKKKDIGNTPVELAEDMLAEGKALELKHGEFEGENIEYFIVLSRLGLIDGYIFNSKDFAPDIIGYSGRIFMMFYR